MTLNYARQKSRQALESLVSTGSLDKRLIYAAESLICFPREHLPAEEARLTKIAERAFTTWPTDWPCGNEGTTSMLVRMFP